MQSRKQAAACLRHVLGLRRWAPDHIFLGGDSAGGNLACALLSHIAHPHPEVQPLRLAPGPAPDSDIVAAAATDDAAPTTATATATASHLLGGAMLLSPWTYLQSEFRGHVIDSSGDLVSEHVGAVWSSGYLGARPNDNYTDASTAPGEWFVSFPVKRIFVSAGGNEILLPAIEMLVENLQAKQSGFPGQVDFVVGKREAHVAPIYDPFLGCKKECVQGNGLRKWLRAALPQRS
ncbi:hypothetical protein KEM52_003744 [Ascosphaera acerosa]|nr:hypothetical protein KEM52_003744 [Ascosphaera acerosa]